MSPYIFVTIDYRRMKVRKSDYIRAKTKALIDFGYEDLEPSTVKAELNAILDGGLWTSVIGAFVETDEPSYKEEYVEPKKAKKKKK